MKHFRTAVLAAIAAALALTTTALAGSGVGATFNLGETNTVDDGSLLVGTPSTAAAMLEARNGSSLASSFGLLGRLTSPSAPLSSAGVRGMGAGVGAGVWGSQSAGTGVYGTATSGYGARGIASTGTGVAGLHTSTSGTSPGVSGDTSSTTDRAVGVFGGVTSPSPGFLSAGVQGNNNGGGLGVEGTAPSGGVGVAGIAGRTVQYWPTGTGVWGIGSNTGVYADGTYTGLTAGGINAGVSASLHAGSTSSSKAVAGYGGNAYGIYGETSGGDAVRGVSTSGNGIHGTSTDNDAVVGVSTNLSGVAGGSTNGDAIYGEHPGGYAGYFVGDVGITGTLSKGAGAFRIDHPLDPKGKYLQHSFVESPDMMDVYNGNVTTDARGFATVRLPRWFQALNRTFRYQLTVIDRAHWTARAAIWTKIGHNRFTLRTDEPRVRVSWQVTGVRHDRYASSHRIQVVVPKPVGERGKYLHPELFGQPKTKTIGYRAITKTKGER